MRFLKSKIVEFLTFINTLISIIALKQKLINKEDINIVVGAGSTHYNNWFSTNKETLDITDFNMWDRMFKNKKINKILAEHVLEHLDINEIERAINNSYNYLKSDGTFRVAVPDGYHPSKYVNELVKPGGLEPGADGHKVLLNIDIMQNLADKVGFKLDKIEYFDCQGVFHTSKFDFTNGFISRCSKNYIGRFTESSQEYSKLMESIPFELRKQFEDNNISYTSLFVDFVK